MHHVFLQPLSEKEMGRLDDLLLKYGNERAIRTLSELDGFFVALISSAEYIDPDEWLHEVGGRVQKLRREAEEEAFHALLMRYMNSVANDLFEACEEFEPLFVASPTSGEPVFVVEDWCQGYMRGVSLAQWTGLPAPYSKHLSLIALHGLESNYAKVQAMSPDEHRDSIDGVTYAMRALYRHSLALRTA
ncbi:UPF0149 family protein [Pseudomonas fontis]|uniref:UPF0149 family protein n=1 Tax=Pseudomonas fontis TaxID=2942633 RepID=A0ABT5NTS7_9PSED|nr:UPF0149 family protein [Pseudomonas fontis]MDD0977664.1 UPF0149 family protein [Pseudomonas fontis]MDD0991577.1 UPF0149 family protein [Pseudomonas fontis]